MKLVNVDDFVPELHANAKYCTVSVEEAGRWWTERTKGRSETALAIISTLVFLGIILDDPPPPH